MRDELAAHIAKMRSYNPPSDSRVRSLPVRLPQDRLAVERHNRAAPAGLRNPDPSRVTSAEGDVLDRKQLESVMQGRMWSTPT